MKGEQQLRELVKPGFASASAMIGPCLINVADSQLRYSTNRLFPYGPLHVRITMEEIKKSLKSVIPTLFLISTGKQKGVSLYLSLYFFFHFNPCCVLSQNQLYFKKSMQCSGNSLLPVVGTLGYASE